MPVHLDAQAKPPAAIKEVYKKFQRLDKKALDCDRDIVDVSRSSLFIDPRFRVIGFDQLPEELQHVANGFPATPRCENGYDLYPASDGTTTTRPAIVEINSIPGLQIYPSLFPPSAQISLLSQLFHRDLSNQTHNTNVHLHYNLPAPGPESFFSPSSSSLTFNPKDPSLHKPFTTQAFLNKKLRWMTLGGQYDWTSKTYPTSTQPPFPADIKNLLEQSLPGRMTQMRPEAAIVNLYSPGDTLSLHRDVSEESAMPLLSLSLGCEGVFVVGLESEATRDSDDHDDQEDEDAEADVAVEAIRLRSGDTVVMGGKSRFAWHGVPKVLAGTCPEWVSDWPCVDGEEFEEWKGWMGGKRVNLNVRQMFD